MSSTSRRLILACALLGLGAAVSASYVHNRLLTDPTYSSFCDISSTMNCAEVYLSRFGSFRGAPVAVLGALWFALVLVLLIVARRGGGALAENVPAYIFALSTLGLAAVLYLGYASFFILKTVCLLCVATYVAVIGIFIVSGAATTFPMTTLPRRAVKDLRVLLTSPAALVVTALFALGAFFSVAAFTRDARTGTTPAAQSPAITQDARSEFERWFESLKPVALPVPADGAVVTVVKFNDYQCPPCRQSFMDYKPILEKYQQKYPGAVRLVTKDYPLEGECNASVSRDLHPAACEAAVAVRLARGKGKAEELEERIFANQQSLSGQFVREALKEVAGLTSYDAEYKRVLEQVKSDAAMGTLLGVRSTPTFFINGRQVPSGFLPPQYFDAAIAYELKKAGK
jgi:uncharacterized membrane protein/protein-disulfide isomerase